MTKEGISFIHGGAGGRSPLSTGDALLNVSSSILRDKYNTQNTNKGCGFCPICQRICQDRRWENGATPVLDRQFAQLRQIEPVAGNTEKSVDALQCKSYTGSIDGGFGDTLGRTYLYFHNEWDRLIAEKNAWQAMCEDCYLILRNSNPDLINNNNRGIIAQCQTRFSPKRRKETHQRMDMFSKKVGEMQIKKGLQITLTTDPKKYDSLAGVGDAWYFQLSKFIDWMNIRLRRAGNKGTSVYLTAKEITESGLLHVHIGIYAKGLTGKILMRSYNRHTRKHEYIREYLFPKEDIKKEWAKLGVGEITWINAAPVNEVVDYVTKHVSKSWGGKSNDMLEAFLHSTNLRQWTSSRGAIPKPAPSVEKWERIEFAFSPAGAALYRQDMIDANVKIIKDDLSELKAFRLEAS